MNALMNACMMTNRVDVHVRVLMTKTTDEV